MGTRRVKQPAKLSVEVGGAALRASRLEVRGQKIADCGSRIADLRQGSQETGVKCFARSSRLNRSIVRLGRTRSSRKINSTFQQVLSKFIPQYSTIFFYSLYSCRIIKSSRQRYQRISS